MNDDRIVLAHRHGRTISAVYDTTLEKFDDWESRTKGGEVLGWSRPGDRQANVGGELGEFFVAAREQDFAAHGYAATAAGKLGASKFCNCNPDNEPVKWKPAKKPKPPVPPEKRKDGRGGRAAKEWGKYIHELSLELGLNFHRCKTLGEIDRILRAVEAAKEEQKRIAKADAALEHARAWDEDQRRKRRERDARRLAKIAAAEALAKEKRDRANARRRDARLEAKIEAAKAQKKRDDANARRREARALKKGTKP